MSKGGLCARGQASILNLYDPDRLRGPVSMIRGSMTNTPTTWAEVDKKLIERLNTIKAHGGKVRVLTGTINSPSTLKLINEFVKSFANGEHVVYDAISDGEISHSQELAYGTKVTPRY